MDLNQSFINAVGVGRICVKLILTVSKRWTALSVFFFFFFYTFSYLLHIDPGVKVWRSIQGFGLLLSVKSPLLVKGSVVQSAETLQDIPPL